MSPRTLRALALFAALHTTWEGTHPLGDHLLQRSQDATGKALPAPLGPAHCAAHVATYTAGQDLTALLVTRAVGYRVPAGPWLAGCALNALTHYAIDRRAGFIRTLRQLGLGSYLDTITAQRRPGCVDTVGPGTALYECDQAVHRWIGVLASAVTTWLVMRGER